MQAAEQDLVLGARIQPRCAREVEVEVVVVVVVVVEVVVVVVGVVVVVVVVVTFTKKKKKSKRIIKSASASTNGLQTFASFAVVGG